MKKNVVDILEIISKHAREVLPSLANHQFQSGDVLKDLGANSIDRSDIIMMTLESLALNIPMIEVAGAESIGELASILHEKL